MVSRLYSPKPVTAKSNPQSMLSSPRNPKKKQATAWNLKALKRADMEKPQPQTIEKSGGDDNNVNFSNYATKEAAIAKLLNIGSEN